MNQLITFAPDANPLTPGIAISVTNAYPSANGGFRAMPTATAFSDAMNSKCLGAFAFQDLDNNFRTIAGTATKLYELGQQTWSDVSLATGYSATKWRFAGWGDYILATDFTNPLQVQLTGSTDFASVAGAPQAKYITASNNFVILANISGYPNRIQWCAQGDYTDWTPSLSTQAGYYDISDSPGEITGVARLRGNIVVFKERSMYLGTYVGPPYIWNFSYIQAHSGTYSQESVIELENGIYYVGLDDFYVYDGTNPVGLGAGVRFWFLNTMDRTYQPDIRGVYDGIKRFCAWYYPTAASGTGELTEGLVYDYVTKRWGRVVQSVEAAVVHWTPGITYDGLVDYFATYTILEANAPAYDNPWWSQKSFGMGIITPDHKMALYNDIPGTSQIITGDYGSLQGYSRILKAYPYFNISPTTCTGNARAKTMLGGTATAGTAQSLKTDGSIDLDTTGKFLAVQLDMTGDWELVGFDAETKGASVN